MEAAPFAICVCMSVCTESSKCSHTQISKCLSSAATRAALLIGCCVVADAQLDAVIGRCVTLGVKWQQLDPRFAAADPQP